MSRLICSPIVPPKKSSTKRAPWVATKITYRERDESEREPRCEKDPTGCNEQQQTASPPASPPSLPRTRHEPVASYSPNQVRYGNPRAEGIIVLVCVRASYFFDVRVHLFVVVWFCSSSKFHRELRKALVARSSSPKKNCSN